jgi:hypothetical protein
MGFWINMKMTTEHGDISVGEVDIDFDANGDVADVELARFTKLR